MKNLVTIIIDYMHVTIVKIDSRMVLNCTTIIEITMLMYLDIATEEILTKTKFKILI
jgi:hypothetical protein